MEMETSSSFREAWKGVNQHLAPMLVVRLEDFELFGEIPRFSDEVGVPFLDLPADMKVVFVSHRWARASEQPPHPDHPDNSKHRLVRGTQPHPEAPSITFSYVCNVSITFSYVCVLGTNCDQVLTIFVGIL